MANIDVMYSSNDNHGIYDVFIKFMKSAWKKKKSGVGNMLSCMLGEQLFKLRESGKEKGHRL